MKFNGTLWEAAGTAGFTPGSVGFISIAFNGGAPYVLFEDQGNGNKATVMKYYGGN